MFSHISTTVNLPKLANCKLKDIDAREEALTRFLHQCPSLKILEMCNIALTEGTWRPVFESCSRTLDHLTLWRLFEYRMVLFPGTRQNEVYVVSGEELKRGIAYWEGGLEQPSYWGIKSCWIMVRRRLPMSAFTDRKTRLSSPLLRSCSKNKKTELDGVNPEHDSIRIFPARRRKP